MNNQIEPTNHEVQPVDISFFVIEFLIFCSQILTIYLVGFFISGLFKNEKALLDFALSKLQANSIGEFGLTVLAILVLIGLIATVTEFFPTHMSHKILRKVIEEFPRTIYLFGSSLTATLLSVATFSVVNSNSNTSRGPKYFLMSGIFGFMFFVMGCGLKAFIQYRRNLQASQSDLQS